MNIDVEDKRKILGNVSKIFNHRVKLTAARYKHAK